jgi:hypothetical protein
LNPEFCTHRSITGGIQPVEMAKKHIRMGDGHFAEASRVQRDREMGIYLGNEEPWSEGMLTDI